MPEKENAGAGPAFVLAALCDYFAETSFTSNTTATFGGYGLRGSAPKPWSGGRAISHLEPAGMLVSASRMPFISTALILMPVSFSAAGAASGRLLSGNGPVTSRSTVLEAVGLAPVPVSITRYWTPLGRDFTPG